ncbi:MAG: type II toxin-antitoxin system VapC family toxin [Firmicutes bacterium]|nr:type II toxin-antitoxin system VapC family toxin [Bacillota bacterium]
MKLVVDSNVFISALDPNDVFHSQCYPVLEKMLSAQLEAVCPVLVLAEVTCVIRRRTGSEGVAAAVCHQLVRWSSISWTDITLDVAESASILGAQIGVKGGDAIVLQVALEYGVPLLTLDKEMRLKAPPNVMVITPSDTA